MIFPLRAVMLSCRRNWASCTFRTIPASIALLVLLLFASASQGFAATPSLETVVTGQHQRIEKLDYRATGRLTKVDGSGKRTTYKFAAKAHWFPDGLRLLFEVSGTGTDKTSLLMRLSSSGRMTIEALLPGEKAASALPADRWNDPLVGTDFSYEDMIENWFFWKNQELQPSAKYGTKDCFVLKSTSGAQDRSAYSSVTSWIDQSILLPVQVVKTLRGTGQLKEFVSYGLRQNGGVWSASQLEAKLPGKPGSSILVIEAGSPKANLAAKDFVLGQSSAAGEKAK